jgi:tellurite resistance-related uncharacterized protein
MSTTTPTGETISSVTLFLLTALATTMLSRANTASVHRLLQPFGLARLFSAVDGMPEMPKDMVQYSQLPSKKRNIRFTATTIPKGLLKEHSTKQGTWGVIRLYQGRLEYQINQPKRQTFELSKDMPGIIEPSVLHQVRPLTDDVEFVVEFYGRPSTGPVDEKRD